jgi:hypothetical protein
MPLLPLCLIALLAAPALADTPNLSAASQVRPGPVARLAIAQRVMDQSLRTGDVVMLLAAIRIARGVTVRPASRWQKDAAQPVSSDAPQGRPLTADPAGPEALALAQGMAGEDPALQDLVYDLDAQLPRSRPTSVVGTYADLADGGTDVWRIAFFGMSPAELALIGDGDGPLDLTVTDDAGNLICADLSTQRTKSCAFTPARNGFFTVTIANRGEVVASYRLIGN